ncbi:MAG: YIP1 family protein [Vicinamibacteria bacterium]|jgi:hypothetical protein|nr:YIP1 family protein [Vicinamibacteria bacterium]
MDAESAAPTPRSIGQDLLDLFVAPREAFASLLLSSRFYVPLLLIALTVPSLMYFYTTQVDATELMRARLQDTKLYEKMTPQQQSQIVEAGAKGFVMQSVVYPIFVVPILFLLIAALYWAIFNFFLGAEALFQKCLTVVYWSFWLYFLVTISLTLLVLALKGDWNIPMENALQANLAVFLDRKTASAPLYAVAASFDLASFWFMFLLASGFGVAAQKSTAWAAWGVASLWVLYVGLKLIPAFLFGLA